MVAGEEQACLDVLITLAGSGQLQGAGGDLQAAACQE
jgi:hypothetical protein